MSPTNPRSILHDLMHAHECNAFCSLATLCIEFLQDEGGWSSAVEDMIQVKPLILQVYYATKHDTVTIRKYLIASSIHVDSSPCCMVFAFVRTPESNFIETFGYWDNSCFSPMVRIASGSASLARNAALWFSRSSECFGIMKRNLRASKESLHLALSMSKVSGNFP